MLTTNTTSSIQKRRQQHRRQQSLEVPILATPLPVKPTHRNRPGPQGHRRGLSLDQSLSAIDPPTGFRSFISQDHGLPTGTPPVRIHLETTNTGLQHPDQQHFVQETQQHRPDQPGHPAQDFQSHLHDQLNGNTAPIIVAPTPTHPHEQPGTAGPSAIPTTSRVDSSKVRPLTCTNRPTQPIVSPHPAPLDGGTTQPTGRSNSSASDHQLAANASISWPRSDGAKHSAALHAKLAESTANRRQACSKSELPVRCRADAKQLRRTTGHQD